MQRTQTMRRRMTVLSLFLVATGIVAVQPVIAQDPAPAQPSASRFRVLIPNLERKGEVRPDFGKKVAEIIAKSIEKLPTHTPVESKEVKESLRKFKLKEAELDCIKSRQLAVQINAELVMCGQYEAGTSGFQVAAQFISAKTGETFEVAPFPASEPAQAAQHIFSSFENYVKQISLAAFCADYLSSQQWPNALENCNQALTINPNSQIALMGKAMALYRLGMAADQSAVTDSARLAESLTIYKKVLELNPVNQDAMRQAGVLAARLGQAEESRQYFRQYMELNPGDVGVRLAIASEASKNGDPEGALRIVEEGLKNDSASLDLMTYAGHFAVQAAQKAPEKDRAPFFTTAAMYYERVFAKQDTATDPSILQNLILADVQLGKKQEAVEIGRRAVVARPKDAAVWVAYATALQSADRTNEALAALDTAVSIDPKFPRLMLRRATTLLSAGRLAEAKQAFRESVERGGVDANEAAQAVFVEGFEQYRANDFDEALEYFAVARDLATEAKGRGQANFWTGMIYYQRGIAVAKPQTTKAARAALPIFRQALEYFQSGGVDAYASGTRGVNLGQTVSAVRQYIDIQNTIIKRGQ
jgi:tetratricopeptide (TPR) repeat protein